MGFAWTQGVEVVVSRNRTISTPAFVTRANLRLKTLMVPLVARSSHRIPVYSVGNSWRWVMIPFVGDAGIDHLETLPHGLSPAGARGLSARVGDSKRRADRARPVSV